MAENSVSTKKKPLISARSKGISVSLFRPFKEGQSRTLVVQKSWPVGGGKYERRSVSFFEDDIPNLQQALKDFFSQYESLHG